MYGSKRSIRRQRRAMMDGRLWQGYVYPDSKWLRSTFKQQIRNQTIDEIPSGAHYRKIGGWFEWN